MVGGTSPAIVQPISNGSTSSRSFLASSLPVHSWFSLRSLHLLYPRMRGTRQPRSSRKLVMRHRRVLWHWQRSRLLIRHWCRHYLHPTPMHQSTVQKANYSASASACASPLQAPDRPSPLIGLPRPLLAESLPSLTKPLIRLSAAASLRLALPADREPDPPLTDQPLLLIDRPPPLTELHPPIALSAYRHTPSPQQ